MAAAQKLNTGSKRDPIPLLNFLGSDVFLLMFLLINDVVNRGKLGNGEHLSLEAYKYKKYNIYVLIIMQHKEHVKFYPETHFY